MTLGRTDLRVTRLCQGTAFRTLTRDDTDRAAERVLRHGVDAGVRFFDSSNAYGGGGAERLLGRVLRGRRDEVVICTKVSPALPSPPGARAAFTGAFLRQQVEDSLRRLDTDHVDLYLRHQPDGRTEPGVICDGMQALVDAGFIRHWGVSNHTANQVAQLRHAAEATGTRPPAGVEDYYTVAGGALDDAGYSRMRVLEREMLPVLRSTGTRLDLPPEALRTLGQASARYSEALEGGPR